MSNLQIEERITVNAPVEKVWSFLLSPEDIVTCLPGAGLDEIEDDRNFHGNIKVKVGPVTVAYKGKATLTEVDDAQHRVTMVGEGKEKVGNGKVKMTMNSVVEANPDGGSSIVVQADVQLAGKVVRFGRGMIQGVSGQVFKEFGERLRAQLETPAADVAADADELDAEAVLDEPEDADNARSDPEGTADTRLPAPAEADALDTAATQPPSPAVRLPAPAAEQAQAIDGLALVWRVLWLGITNFFRRLFGRAEKS